MTPFRGRPLTPEERADELLDALSSFVHWDMAHAKDKDGRFAQNRQDAKDRARRLLLAVLEAPR